MANPADGPPTIRPDDLLSLLENASDVVFRYRMIPPRGYEYISPSVVTLTGYSAAEHYADPDLAVRTIHPDDLVAAVNPDALLARLRVVRRDGRLIHIEQRTRRVLGDDGTLVAIEGIVRDVSDRVEGEAALRRSEASFRALIDLWPDMVFLSHDGVIVFANAAAVAFHGGPGDDLRGRSIFDLMRIEDHAHARERIARVEAEGRATSPALYVARNRAGREATVEARTISMPFDGRPCLLTILLDVTERVALESRVTTSERLASLGTLAAGIAHEINNPLAYVAASLEHAARLLARGDVAAADLPTAIGIAREGVDRIARIVRDVRTVARTSEKGPLVPVDVVATLDAALGLAAPALDEARARVVRDHPSRCIVAAEESRLVRVLVNLLVNAAQALEAAAPDGREVHVTVRREGAGVEIAIRDTGAGIPKENLQRIFDPFFTTKPVGQALGLGLSLCHGMVASMRGEIRVESTDGRGSTFTIRLDASDETPSVRPPSGEAADTGPRARLLFVDDEPALCTGFARLVGSRHDVVTATSAREALDLLRRGERFDVVFCDLMMPDMTGMELYEALGEHAPDVRERVVFVTGGAHTQRANDFLEEGRHAPIEKPFDGPAIERTVRERLAVVGRAS